MTRAILLLATLAFAPAVGLAQTDPLASLRIHHAAIRTADFDGTVRFYTEVLGFRRDAGWREQSFEALYLVRDGFRIEVLGGGAPRGETPPAAVPDHLVAAGYRHLCFEVDDVDAAAAELKRRGVRFITEPFTWAPIERRLAHFLDNNGNVLELSGPVRPDRRQPVREP